MQNGRDEEDSIFTELDEIRYKSLYYIIDTSIKKVFAEQEGLPSFIDKKIEKESHIQCASCAKNG